MTLTVAGSFTPPQAGRATQVRVYTGTEPAAGSEVSETVPAGTVWTLFAIELALNTSAIVADRTPQLLVTVSGFEVYAVVPGSKQPASTLTIYSYWQGAASLSASIRSTLPIAPMMLPAGAALATSTANLQATDQWLTPVFYVLAYV